MFWNCVAIKKLRFCEAKMPVVGVKWGGVPMNFVAMINLPCHPEGVAQPNREVLLRRSSLELSLLPEQRH